MKSIRTPDSQFENLKDYPFQPNYIELEDDLRLHYVDERPDDYDDSAQKPVVMMMHGEPTWSYLYRHMIPVCVAAGHRVIAPDLIGFGKSDKPTKKSDYSYKRHVGWITTFIEKLNLQNIVLVCQDWGSLIGLRVAAENEARFAGIVLGNGLLPEGNPDVPKAFKVWRRFSKYSPIFPIDKIVNSGVARDLNEDEMRAYRAPFPSAKYKAGARIFPSLVPTTPDDPATVDNKAAWKVYEQWQKPFLTSFSDGDPITRGNDQIMQARIPGTKGLPHRVLHGGHFMQEDSPQEFAEAANELIRDYLKK